MRQTITKFVAGAALAVTLGAATASACEVYNPCGGGLFQSGWNYNYGYRAGYGYNGYGYGCGVAAGCGGYVAAGCGVAVAGCGGYVTERLPDPTGPQYYYVNQGPTYTGPGNYAPAPVYQERTVTGWQGYEEQEPNVYTVPRRYHYRPYRVGPTYRYGYRPAYRHYYGYRTRPAVRYGYAPRFYGPHPYMHGPRVRYAPQLGTYGHPLRYKF